MKKTLGEVIDFLGYADAYLGKYEKERSSLTYALQKLSKKYLSERKRFSEKFEDIKSDAEADFCLKDKDTGAFLERDVQMPGHVVARKLFDKKGEIAKKEQIDRELKKLRGEEIDFEPYFVPVPNSLQIEWVNVFTGFVFEKLTEAQELEWYLNQQATNTVKKE